MDQRTDRRGRPRSTRRLRRSAGLLLLLAVMLGSAIGSVTSASQPGLLNFRGLFTRGLVPWLTSGGSAQCANFGVLSSVDRLRGTLSVVRVFGVPAARITLPPSNSLAALQACELTHMRPLKLGADDYYGYMLYVPKGWKDGTVSPRGFWGIATAQFHFQNIWGSPIAFELHSDHVTLALETGPCHNQYSAMPGCEYRSNADNPDGHYGNLGRLYVIRPHMRKGVWHEIVMHVHWAADRTGAIQVWNRTQGTIAWKQTVDLHNYPTVQWDVEEGCCNPVVNDKIGAYRGQANRQASVWVANYTIGTSFETIAASMPTLGAH